MSAAMKEDEVMLCASCGKAGCDDIKLKKCTACHLVRYCSVKCHKEHRPKHKKVCKKRAAELKDELLFKQPESSHLGDCPICCLPVPIDASKSSLNSCCCKYICNGCDYANGKREIEGRLQRKCPFCRKVLPDTVEEYNSRIMNRIEANDPIALRFMGAERYHKGDYKAAFDYFTRAAELGDAEGHNQLSRLYHNGECVEKDEKKELHHTEQAAIGGHPRARHNLGCKEIENCRIDRAVKHWIIAATLGNYESLENLKFLYKDGLVSKEDFEAALRGHKAALDAMKSPQREEAAGSSGSRGA